MELLDHCCTEFIVKGTAPVLQQGDAFPDPVHRNGRNPGSDRIFFDAVFYIHCGIVHQTFRKQAGEHLRMISVGIQLDQKAHGTDFGDQVRKIFVQTGFPACKGNAVQKPPAFFQERDQFRFFHDGRRAAVDQFKVVAERAAEITAV